MINEMYKKALRGLINRANSYKIEKMRPSEWAEQNIIMSGDMSRYTGPLKYDLSPYTREVIDCLDPSNGVEMVGIMKCAQSGFTKTVILPGICYIISENPAPILLTAADLELAKKSIRTGLDPMISNAGMSGLIKPSVVKKKNQRTGDTDQSKEFAGGELTVLGVNSPSKWRQYSVKTIFADDWDNAPRADSKEGSVRSLMENRAKSYGTLRKMFYVSTPTVKNQSNIEEVYLLGDQRKWNWCCPVCNEYIPIEWRVENSDGTFSGIKWDLDENGKLVKYSIRYECQNCREAILEKDKYVLNLGGKWIPTATPSRPEYRSYQLNSLVLPPGFISWRTLVLKWIEIHPKDGPIDIDSLKTFINTELGQTFEEKGSEPDASGIMNNTRDYDPYIVPDELAKEDGNGDIVLITLSCDLGGIMNEHIEDVRLDYEIVAHTSNKVTYNIAHGSIGTFKRNRKRTQEERDNTTNRDMYSYRMGSEYCVWDYLDEVIETKLMSQSGKEYTIDLTVIDTGHFTKMAYAYINKKDDPFIVGVKGIGEEEARKPEKDTPPISKSREMRGRLYIVQTNMLKDTLDFNMRLKEGVNGIFPSGFMNFPTPKDGLYTRKSYFGHFEGEQRVEVMKHGKSIGFAWKKKHGLSENHFFDTSVYTLASTHILIDIYRTHYSKYKNLTWEDYSFIMSSE